MTRPHVVRLGARLALAAMLAVAVGACGASVQRAELSPAAVAIKASPSPSEHDGKCFLVHAGSSRLVVVGTATFSGDHEFTFQRWTGTLVGDPPTQVRMEAEATTIAADKPWVENMIRTDLLETERFPRATIEGDLLPVDGDRDARLVVGNATIHGITRGIRFLARLSRDGDAWRLGATFDMSRKAFDVRLHNRWDAFIADDFRVVLDFRGTEDPAGLGAQAAERATPVGDGCGAAEDATLDFARGGR